MFFVLRLVHIVFGGFWVGSVLFMALFLAPTLKHLGPAGGPVMGHLTQVRKLPTWMLTAAILTILSGAGLFWQVSGGMQGSWFATGPGKVFSAGALLALLTLAIGLTVSMPSARRMGMLMAARAKATTPPTPEEVAELARLQQRLATSQVVAGVLVLGATMAMAVARYT
jgi:hypothetical protein